MNQKLYACASHQKIRSECRPVKKNWLLHGNSSEIFPECYSLQAGVSAQREINSPVHMRKTYWIWKAPRREFSQIPKNCAKKPDVKHPEDRNTLSTRKQCRHHRCKTPLAMPVSYRITKKRNYFFQHTALQSTSKTFLDGRDTLCKKEQGLS